MILTTSALMALWRNSTDASALHTAIMRAPLRLVSAATVLEAAMILMGERRGGSDLELDALLRELDVTVVPFTEDHAHRAREAARTYGMGRHEAALTLGDCVAYALAGAAGEPLLTAGGAFTKTDIERAPY
ncbi:MAG TPA: type II toxin-antitoxin system VapC family toxin [Gemmatimonas sp.]|uniref:type II toxin-antitoxin system VapC family toxin n=1 Tax=Gemmatimonas sp. TaxID=1962908 RepID=UPI002ED9E531